MSAVEVETSAAEVDEILGRAAVAKRWMSQRSAEERRALLSGLALALEAHADELVALAMAETHLPQGRLEGELKRAAGQFRVYGDAIETLQAPEIDEPNPAAVPTPIPRLVRVKVPLGVVLVFAASNFPFAFSVCGTDVASALAAGCPVVVKAHPGHPALSARVAEIMLESLHAAGAPDGVFGLIAGTDAGIAALRDDRVGAGAFTGSIPGGEFLLGVANARRIPIPFYAEMGSLNPVVVAHSAAGVAVLDGFVGSFTLGAGQFCTKPGVLFWPASAEIPAEFVERLGSIPTQSLLNPRIASGFESVAASIFDDPAVERFFGAVPAGASLEVAPIVGITDTVTLRAHHERLLQECFGPAALIVRYDGTADLIEALEAFEGQLTGTIHADDSDHDFVAEVVPVLAERVGRLIWGEWPTGVAVAWSQHHGGPYPASSNPLFTSVGPHAIERFWRPLALQNFPEGYGV
ncbi:MAG: aldehyde dehydrogenase family protein [Pseudolysinimonas sp.]